MFIRENKNVVEFFEGLEGADNEIANIVHSIEEAIEENDLELLQAIASEIVEFGQGFVEHGKRFEKIFDKMS